MHSVIWPEHEQTETASRLSIWQWDRLIICHAGSEVLGTVQAALAQALAETGAMRSTLRVLCSSLPTDTGELNPNPRTLKPESEMHPASGHAVHLER